MIQANKGYVFVSTDKKAVYGSIIYLGKYSKESDFIQMKEEEASKLKEQLMEELNHEKNVQ